MRIWIHSMLDHGHALAVLDQQLNNFLQTHHDHWDADDGEEKCERVVTEEGFQPIHMLSWANQKDCRSDIANIPCISKDEGIIAGVAPLGGSH
ncbi:MAG TPA: hypothetical protein VGP94_08930 [Tepidisphaeraceae bacterium]|nr:hypothetical protein [Tepidisphaeraceae bacterium]